MVLILLRAVDTGSGATWLECELRGRRIVRDGFAQEPTRKAVEYALNPSQRLGRSEIRRAQLPFAAARTAALCSTQPHPTAAQHTAAHHARARAHTHWHRTRMRFFLSLSHSFSFCLSIDLSPTKGMS